MARALLELLSNADQRDTVSDRILRGRYRSQWRGDRRDRFANLLTNRTLRRVPLGAKSDRLSASALLRPSSPACCQAFYAAGAILSLGCAHYALAQYLFTRARHSRTAGIPLLVQLPGTFSQPFSSDTVMSGNRCRGRSIPARRPELVRGSLPVDRHRELRETSAGMQLRDLGILMSEDHESDCKARGSTSGFDDGAGR